MKSILLFITFLLCSFFINNLKTKYCFVDPKNERASWILSRIAYFIKLNENFTANEEEKINDTLYIAPKNETISPDNQTQIKEHFPRFNITAMKPFVVPHLEENGLSFD